MPPPANIDIVRKQAEQTIREMAERLVAGGKDATRTFLDGVADDVAHIWTVPLERQEVFLRRIEAQARAVVELHRLKIVGGTRDTIATVITSVLRVALRLLAP